MIALRRIKTYLNTSTLRYLWSHPKSLLGGAFQVINSRIVGEVARCFDVSPQMVQQFLAELYEDHSLNLKDVRRKMSTTEGGLKLVGTEWLYLAVRILQPSVVLETGVSAGFSSAVILLAMGKNEKGHLHSIDIADFTTSEKEVGWIIPLNLRERWTFHIGKSTEVMRTLLPKLGQIDIFLHDSDHSYFNMLSEYRMVYPIIRPGGLLLSDDIDRNRAFSDFCVLMGIDSASKNKYFGVLRKPDYEEECP